MIPNSFLEKLEVLFYNHWNAFKASFERIKKNSLSSVMTICIISLSLALPLGFATIIDNVQRLSGHWHPGIQISLYLKQGINETIKEDLLNQLRTKVEIESVKYISPDEGLQFFEKEAGFRDLLLYLPNNPLPPVIEVIPSKDYRNPTLVQDLVKTLNQLPAIETVQLDLQWLERLHHLIIFLKQIVYFLMAVLVSAVLVVSGHMIRLITRQQHQEIRVISLVGGALNFIRRPFLYTGFFYGFMGGIFAWILMLIMVMVLNNTLVDLARLYEMNFSVKALDPLSVILLLLSSGMIGWLGAWFAINREIIKIRLVD